MARRSSPKEFENTFFQKMTSNDNNGSRPSLVRIGLQQQMQLCAASTSRIVTTKHKEVIKTQVAIEES